MDVGSQPSAGSFEWTADSTRTRLRQPPPYKGWRSEVAGGSLVEGDGCARCCTLLARRVFSDTEARVCPSRQETADDGAGTGRERWCTRSFQAGHDSVSGNVRGPSQRCLSDTAA